MSSPQENPDRGHDGENRTAGAPYGQGDRSSYGQQGHAPIGGAGQDRQESPTSGPAGRPSDYYAYPSAASLPQQAEKGPVPQNVLRASYLIIAAGALYFLSNVGVALFTDFSTIPGAEGTAVTVGRVFAVVVATLGAAVYVLLAVFIRKGHNWARIVATVLAGINVAFTLVGLLLTPFANAQADALGAQTVQAPLLSTAAGVIVMLLGLAGVVLTYTRPARPYFAPRPLGY